MIYLLVILGGLILLYFGITFFISGTVIYLNRQPVPKNPKDYGMDFEATNFKAEDGVDISGWLIPGSSNKLVVITHVGGLTKYGSTTSYKNISKLYNKEIEFLKVAKHLHNKGYWVLMFDFRNHGESEKSPNGGKAGVGLEEYKDVVAALNYLKQKPETKDLDIGFVSFCMGANSTIIAMSKKPEAFDKVKCMVAIQPISMEVFIHTYMKVLFKSLGSKLIFPMVKKFVNMRSEHKLEDMSPKDYVKDIKVPTLYVQTKNDPWTELSDIKGFYDNTPAEREFFWIKDTTHRFQGYQFFQERPERMLEWLKRYMN